MTREFMMGDEEIDAIISDFVKIPLKNTSCFNAVDDSYNIKSSQISPSSIYCSSRSFYDDDMLDYLLKDITEKKAEEAEETLKKNIESHKRKIIKDFIKSISKVQFTDPWTIIFWKNGEVTRIKCQDGDDYSKETGLALGIIKHMFGDTNYFNTIFTKLVSEEDN